MVMQARFPSVNPRLATYYAIFTSAVVCLFFVLAVIESLGISHTTLAVMAIFAPILAACAIGLASSNSDIIDFYISGRRVPASYNGLAIAAGSMGSAGIIGLTGCVFFLGYDALALGFGWIAGILVLGILFAPYLRKMGAYTVPGFFAQRFNSNFARLISACVVIIPIALLLIAEIQIASLAASTIFDMSKGLLTFIILSLICLGLVGGGMRSLTWSQCAVYIIVICGFLAPLIITSVQHTNLPLPQMSYGSVLDDLSRIEAVGGIGPAQPIPLKRAMPSNLPDFTQKPFTQPFGLIGFMDFMFLGLCFMIGAATLPGTLTRMSTTPNVLEARKSAAWALVFVGVIVISIPAYAVFTKLTLAQALPQFAIDQLPRWITNFEAQGIFSFGNSDKNTLDLQNLGIKRDGVFLLLPYAAQFPYVLVVLSVLTIVLAAIAAASAQLITLSNIISHDIISTFFIRGASEKIQIHIARICILFIAMLIGWISVNGNYDSFKLLAYAFSISGSAIFPPLVLAIWWRSCNKSAAITGMLAGLLTALLTIWLAESGMPLLGVDGYVAAVLGFPVGLAVTVVISFTSAEPIKIHNEIIDDIRIPGGEALYDRALRNKQRRLQKKLALKKN
ncbi:MAG: VC_2705 family sodium/solute symporter [Methyloligellaceae bacterium]